MNWLEQHEVFEMEVLEKLKSSRLLESLIFGGGTMLRLCHELPRYSVDLDFWKLKAQDDQQLLNRLVEALGKNYEITDAQLKHFTILVELRSLKFPRRLKIEIRRQFKDWDYEEKIAFSTFSNKQVLLKGFTLAQMMKNKVAAFLTRGAIRDAFDMEFLLRKGIALPALTVEQREQLLKQIDRFTLNDFKVTLGSVIAADWREYYVQHGFKFLKEKLAAPSDEIKS
ncbi:nucleotidyl transferase AbiEii/AbiGii toxin family protein [Calditrichota bacterium GD2]